jgi:uncharacterized protein YbbK (DUF523 family)
VTGSICALHNTARYQYQSAGSGSAIVQTSTHGRQRALSLLPDQQVQAAVPNMLQRSNSCGVQAQQLGASACVGVIEADGAILYSRGHMRKV